MQVFFCYFSTEKDSWRAQRKFTRIVKFNEEPLLLELNIGIKLSFEDCYLICVMEVSFWAITFPPFFWRQSSNFSSQPTSQNTHSVNWTRWTEFSPPPSNCVVWKAFYSNSWRHCPRAANNDAFHCSRMCFSFSHSCFLHISSGPGREIKSVTRTVK